MRYKFQVLDDEKFNNLPGQNMEENVGVAYPEKGTAYIRYSGDSVTDAFNIAHELEHLKGEDLDELYDKENKCYYKKAAWWNPFGGSFLGTGTLHKALLPIGQAITGAVGGPLAAAGLGAAYGAGHKGITDYQTGQKGKPGSLGGALQGGLQGYGFGGLGQGLGRAISGLKGGLGKVLPGFMSGAKKYFGTDIIPGIQGSNPLNWLQSLFRGGQGEDNFGGGQGTIGGQNSAVQGGLAGWGIPSLAGAMNQANQFDPQNLMNPSSSGTGMSQNKFINRNYFRRFMDLFGGGSGGWDKNTGLFENPLSGFAGAGILGAGELMNRKINMPDFRSNPEVRALTDWSNTANHPLDPNVRESIQRTLDIQNEQQLRNLRDIYKNARPGTDYTTDSAYQRDLERLNRSMAMQGADAMAEPQLASNQQQLANMENLAQLSVGRDLGQTGIEAERQKTRNKLFGNIASMFLNRGLGNQYFPMANYGFGGQ